MKSLHNMGASWGCPVYIEVEKRAGGHLNYHSHRHGCVQESMHFRQAHTVYTMHGCCSQSGFLARPSNTQCSVCSLEKLEASGRHIFESFCSIGCPVRWAHFRGVTLRSPARCNLLQVLERKRHDVVFSVKGAVSFLDYCCALRLLLCLPNRRAPS